MTSASRTRVTLTSKHLSDENGRELCQLLADLASDGVISDDEITELGRWLEAKQDAARIPGIAYLRELVKETLANGVVDETERTMLHRAMLRVLPPQQRDHADELRKKAAELRHNQSRVHARDMATDRQIDYITNLGGVPAPNMTKEEASTMITSLITDRPTVRQRMVLRFWDKVHLESEGRSGINTWLDGWYDANPARLLAWELWKKEVGDDGERDPMLIDSVPVGIGKQYLQRVNGNPSGCLHMLITLFLILSTLFWKKMPDWNGTNELTANIPRLLPAPHPGPRDSAALRL